ncbi:MAG: protein kinase, partial [Myxococcota bacterium]
MDRSWARAYADRWGLPLAAVAELNNQFDVVRSHDAETDPDGVLLHSEPTSPPLSLGDDEAWSSPSEFGERYEEMGLIGEGGMGEVRRMWDAALNRAVAMKVLRRDLADREDLVLRFVEEAQATAQLEHPGIVPVYEIGKLPDRRPYFTMKEIRGRSLLDVIEELHAASSDGAWGTTSTGWTFQRLIGVFQQVCEAVAYAHSRGVLHRDLKPTNVMVGAFGEVVVMDWGLAKIAGQTQEVRASGGGRVVTARSRGALYQTRSGSVAGTPNYMPPEQARGDHGLIGPWSDVYSLGALLYEILADRAPYDGDELDEVVARVLAAPPPPPIPRWQSRRSDEGGIEEGLRAICAKAMGREITERYMDATSMAEAVSDWLERAGARDHAIGLVRRAEQLEPELVTLRSRVVNLRAEAERRLATLPREAPFEEKREAWLIEDQAAELERELRRTESRYADLLKAALAGAPNLPEALSRLEGVDEPGHALPDPGHGAITLQTDPPGATVVLRRIDVVDRRLVPVVDESNAPRVPVRAPLDAVPLPAGTWQIELSHEEHAPLTVLARVIAGERWSTGPMPAGRPVKLAPAGVDEPWAVRVPAGWFQCGGDRENADALPQSRAWVGPFLIGRFPVTCGDWLAFLTAFPGASSLVPPGFTRG